jgi:hypothetical protein
MIFKNTNKSQLEMTATPDKYPQRYFDIKACRECKADFQPVAPSHLYCSDVCAERGYSRRYLRRAYDISLEQYEEMFVDPHCRICGSEGFIVARNGKAKLAVDHDHSTGKIRGLLCPSCNQALGLFGDSADNLRKAIEYLEGATTISKESTGKCLEARDSDDL